MSRFGWLISVFTPTFSQALCLWLGLLVVVFAPATWGVSGTLVIDAAVLLLGFLVSKSRRWLLPVLGAILMLRFLLVANGYIAAQQQRLALHDTKLVVSGQVVELLEQTSKRQLFLFEVEGDVTLGDELAGEILRVSWYRSAAGVAAGERWQLPLKLKAPRSFRNVGGADYEHWFYRQGWLMNAYVRKGNPARLAAAEQTDIGIRSRVAEGFKAALFGEPYGGVLLALATADKSGIANSQWEQFRQMGLSHLLAISGLHIGIVAALGFAFGSGIWRLQPAKTIPRPYFQLGSAIVFAAAYAALADWTLPTQRAFIMLAALVLPSFFKLSVSVWQRLGMAVVAVLLWDPWAIINPGFYLSFFAVATLLLAASNRPKPQGWRRWLKALFRIQLLLTLALAPLTIAAFGELPLGGLLANLLMIPLFSLLIVPAVLIAVALSLMPASGLLAEWLWLTHALLEQLMNLLEMLDLQSWTLAFAAPNYAVVMVALLAIVAAILPWPLLIRVALLFCALPLFFVSEERPAADELWVTLLDVGQGQALHLQTADENWLYDTGPLLGKVNAGAVVIEPYLRYLGVKPDAVVVSHDDSDHSGGLEHLQQRYLKMQQRHCVAGEHWFSGSTKFQVLHPPAGFIDSDNNMSCVLLVTHGAHKLLLLGDIETSVERQLLAKYPALLRDITVMTIPHHGSRTSSSSAFVEHVQPEVGLLSVGWKNHFGHPKLQVMKRYDRVGTAVYRTDWHGQVKLRLLANGSTEAVMYLDGAFGPWWKR